MYKKGDKVLLKLGLNWYPGKVVLTDKPEEDGWQSMRVRLDESGMTYTASTQCVKYREML